MRAREFIIESMSPNELRWLDDLADRLLNQLDIDVEFTKHFFDRANDERGDYRDRQGRQHEQGITAEELAKVFVAAYKQASDQNSKFVKVTDIPANAEATIRDHFTKLNIPFVMKKAGGQKVLTPKTVMRKDNFANPPGTKAVPVNSKDVALDESLHDWFNKEKWVRMDTKGKIKGPCAREPGEGKPKCLPQSKAHSLGKKGRASAAQRKRREDPNPDRHGQAINVNTKKKTNEESCPHCNGPMFSEMIMNEKKDACYYKVKSRYKVWPSAYASGALVKCRNKGASNWGNGGKSSKS